MSVGLRDVLEIIERSPSKFKRLGDIVDVLGKQSYVLLMFAVSIPTSIPAPPFGPEHIPFGIVQILLVTQFLRNNNNTQVKIPSVIRKIPIDSHNPWIRKLIRQLKILMQNLPPQSEFLSDRFESIQKYALALVVTLMSALMIIPLPMTNVLPSMMITIATFSFLMNNPLLTAASFALNIVVFVLYILFFIWGGKKLSRMISHYRTRPGRRRSK